MSKTLRQLRRVVVGSAALLAAGIVGAGDSNSSLAPLIKPVLDRLGIDNKASPGNHHNHFHLYLTPPAPEAIGSSNLLAQADADATPVSAIDTSEISSMLLAAAQGVASVKYDKIVNECRFARTYAMDSDMPAMVAKGQYAKSYEENQSLKVNKIEIVSRPKHGSLEVLSNPGPMVSGMIVTPVDTYFKMRSTDNYLGPDRVEYAVELSNGKRVLVRTHIYWVNQDSDSFHRCPPTENDYRDMRRIQKDHPEYFKNLNQLAPEDLPTDVLSWLRQVEFEDAIAAAYNSNPTVTDLPGTAVGQTTGTNITLDTNAAGYNWFIDYSPSDNSGTKGPGSN